MDATMQQDIQNFERLRQQLMVVSSQKQQLEFQKSVMEEAMKELSTSDEKKVYKAVGNILILSDKKKVEKDLESQKKEMEIRTESLGKQETSLVERLNSLKAKIEVADKKDAKKDEKPSKK